MAARHACRRRTRATAAAIVTALAGATFAIALPAAAAASGGISGTIFQDTNRDGVLQPGETPMSGLTLYLYDGNGTYMGHSTSDSSGAYSFAGLADGTYKVQMAPNSWYGIRSNWVSTTTAGSLKPIMMVDVTGSTQANFGWRSIVRSTDANAPVSTYTGSSGLHTASYDDVVSAQTVYNAVMAGALVGDEAKYTTVRFDLVSNAITSTMVGQTNGVYTTYSATSNIDYLTWMDSGDTTLFHEYGIAWGRYFASMVQQDPSMTAYLKARGIYGDARVGSSYAWDPNEMIAEDYRQLFGTPNAAAGPQINTDIPPAADVSGLADFLATTFRTPPAGGSSSSTSSSAAPTLTVSSVTAKQDATTKYWTVSAQVSADSNVTVTVRASNGSLVTTLLSNSPRTAGAVSASWNLTDTHGRKVKRGTYTMTVQAATSTQSAQGSATVTV